MMTERLFFNILKASLWGTKLDMPVEFDDWRSLMKLAKSQSVLGLVANVLLSNSELQQRIPVKMQQQLRNFIRSNVATHSVLNRTLVRVVMLMDHAGIQSVLLKGQGVARNYPMPELRQCGDIDLYVGVENYSKACSLIDTIASEKMPENGDSDKHYEAKVGEIVVEIHEYSEINPSAYYDAIYQKYSDEGLSTDLRVLDFSGVSVNTPSDTFNAFYIFNHLWQHFLTSGVGLRQFIDWMLFIHKHKDTIDESKLKCILDDMNLMMPWQVLGCILVNDLGLSMCDFPFYDQRYERKKGRILKMVLKEGNFGHDRAYYKERKERGYWTVKIRSFYYNLERYFQLLMIFPSHALRQFMNMLAIGFKAVWKDKLKTNRD